MDRVVRFTINLVLICAIGAIPGVVVAMSAKKLFTSQRE